MRNKCTRWRAPPCLSYVSAQVRARGIEASRGGRVPCTRSWRRFVVAPWPLTRCPRNARQGPCWQCGARATLESTPSRKMQGATRHDRRPAFRAQGCLVRASSSRCMMACRRASLMCVLVVGGLCFGCFSERATDGCDDISLYQDTATGLDWVIRSG